MNPAKTALQWCMVLALASTAALAQNDGMSDVKDPEVRALVTELYNMGLKDAALRVLSNYRFGPRPAPGTTAITTTPKPNVAPVPPKPEAASDNSAVSKTADAAPTVSAAPVAAPVAAVAPPVPKPVRQPRWETPDMRGVELLADTGARIEVRKFVFNKTNLVPEDELQGVLAHLIGQELDHAKLLGAALKVNEYYRSKGYLARAVLPEQPLDFGIVKVVVLETRPILGE
jgi:hypothetical protein